MNKFTAMNKSKELIQMVAGENKAHMKITDSSGNVVEVTLDENQLCHIQELLRCAIDDY